MQEEYGQPIESEVEPQEPASPISLQELELSAGNPEYSLDDFMFEHLNDDDFGASTFEPKTTQEMQHMLSE